MTFIQFEEMLDDLKIPLKENHKKVLYPMIAIKNDTEIEVIKFRLREIKKSLETNKKE